MLSYRHGFHAGNFADVLKHAVLVALLQALQRKDKPFVYIDTHAGAGGYDLQSPLARQTEEFHTGILRLWRQTDHSPELAAYLDIVRQFNPSGRLRYYPGSPLIAQHLCRAMDRLLLSERHPSDSVSLQTLCAGDRRIQVLQEDGLTQIKAKLPPRERRGLIFIDPSYEMKHDYAAVIAALCDAHTRFATGIYSLWYPVIERHATEHWLDKIRRTGLRRLLRIEYCPRPDCSGGGMTGSGLVLINPPWQLDEWAQCLLPELDAVLGEPGSHWQVTWLAGE